MENTLLIPHSQTRPCAYRPIAEDKVCNQRGIYWRRRHCCIVTFYSTNTLDTYKYSPMFFSLVHPSKTKSRWRQMARDIGQKWAAGGRVGGWGMLRVE